MIRVAICDDSEFMRKETDKALFDYCMEKDVDYTAKQFESGESLLKEVTDFDLIFLDYQFENKGKDGMSIARDIRKINAEVTIIFLSSYTSIVYDTFEVAAFRFLVKPIDKEKLYSAMDDYYNSLNSENTLAIKAEGINHYLKESQISYVEGNGKKSIIHCINKDDAIECNETLSAIEERVSPKLFFRCHKSFLVNMKYIDSFSHTDVILQDGESVMISRQKYKTFCDGYSDYLARTKGF
jgi:DNA-binding LytR/AlgR family response regulator